MAFIAIATGGRCYYPTETDYRWLDRMLESHGFSILLHGAAGGLDTAAAEWAVKRGVCAAGCPARWDDAATPSQRAKKGPERNRRMAEACIGADVICLAFPGGPGTRNMRRVAKECEIAVFIAPTGDIGKPPYAIHLNGEVWSPDLGSEEQLRSHFRAGQLYGTVRALNDDREDITAVLGGR